MLDLLAAIFPASQLAILPYNRIVKDLNGMDAASLLERLAESEAEVGACACKGPRNHTKDRTIN